VIPALSLTVPGRLHAPLRSHLLPGDGREAAAVLLCARAPGGRVRLLARDIIAVPHGACASRRKDAITWPGEYLEKAIDAAEPEGLAIVPIHSHPGGLFGFSPRDDVSDAVVMRALFQAHGTQHGSAIMTPDGAMRARVYAPDLSFLDVPLVSVVGDDIQFWWSDGGPAQRRPMAFTGAMTRELARLCAVVIGVSGTGSLVAEQLARLGFGRVILIDFDRIERKNLNRIVNSVLADVAARRLKVESFTRAVDGYRGPDVAVPVAKSITTREAVATAATGDVLFSCVDTLEARQIADRLRAARRVDPARPRRLYAGHDPGRVSAPRGARGAPAGSRGGLHPRHCRRSTGRDHSEHARGVGKCERVHRPGLPLPPRSEPELRAHDV
jgi:hypothetical protein